MWSNLVSRHLRNTEFRTFKFFCLFNLGNEITQIKIIQMLCYGNLSISLSTLSEVIHLSLFLETLSLIFILLQRKIFAYIAALLCNVWLWRQTLVALLTKLCHYQIMPIRGWEPKGEKMWEFLTLLPVLSRVWISASLFFSVFSSVSDLRWE